VPRVLDDATARELAAIGARSSVSSVGRRTSSGAWIAGGGVVLLQSRPITGMPRRTVWSNANIAENFPDPVTPLLFSIVARGYTAYFRNLGLGFGLAPRRIAAMRESLAQLVGLQGGRLYYNLTNIHAVLRLAPGGERLAAWFNDFTGACELPATHVPPLTAWERCVEPLRIAACVAWKYATLERRVARFEGRVDDFAARTRPQDLAARDAEALARDLDAFLEIRLARWNDAALADAAAMVCYGLLGRMLAGASPNDLLKGLPGLASARPVSELWKLSRVVRGDEKLRVLFENHSAVEIARAWKARSTRRSRRASTTTSSAGASATRAS
jgi:pyruvate,water dikinase